MFCCFCSGSKVEQGNQRCCGRCGPEINLRRPLRRYSTTTTTTFPPLLFPRLLIGTTFFFFPPVSCRCCLRRHDTTTAAADVARKTQRPQLDFNCPAATAAAPTANLIVCFNYSVRTVLLVCLAGGWLFSFCRLCTFFVPTFLIWSDLSRSRRITMNCNCQ